MKKIAICLVLGLCAVAAAQDKPKSSGEDVAKPMEKKTGGEGGQMAMPKPSPEMQKLSKMVAGTWSTTEKYEPSPWAPKGATAKGKAVFKNGPGGLSVIPGLQVFQRQGKLHRARCPVVECQGRRLQGRLVRLRGLRFRRRCKVGG